MFGVESILNRTEAHMYWRFVLKSNVISDKLRDLSGNIENDNLKLDKMRHVSV